MYTVNFEEDYLIVGHHYLTFGHHYLMTHLELPHDYTI